MAFLLVLEESSSILNSTSWGIYRYTLCHAKYHRNSGVVRFKLPPRPVERYGHRQGRKAPCYQARVATVIPFLLFIFLWFNLNITYIYIEHVELVIPALPPKRSAWIADLLNKSENPVFLFNGMGNTLYPQSSVRLLYTINHWGPFN